MAQGNRSGWLRRCETPPSPPAPDSVGIRNYKQLFSLRLAFTTQKIATHSTDIISAVCVAFFLYDLYSVKCNVRLYSVQNIGLNVGDCILHMKILFLENLHFLENCELSVQKNYSSIFVDKWQKLNAFRSNCESYVSRLSLNVKKKKFILWQTTYNNTFFHFRYLVLF